MDVRTGYPELDVNCNLTPWLVRHAAWLMARYHTRSRDGFIPYRTVNGTDNNHPLATLGDIVLGNNTKRQTAEKVPERRVGAIAVRSIRRLPEEADRQ